MASRYAISILPMAALAFMSLTRRSRAISRWNSPMPLSSVWPDSSSSETCRLGSSRISRSKELLTAFSSLMLWGSTLEKKTAGGTSMGRSCSVFRGAGGPDLGFAPVYDIRVSPVLACFKPGMTPIWPAGIASIWTESEAYILSSCGARSEI